MINDTVVPESICPNCNQQLDRASSIRECDGAPTPGSVGICICCAAILMYDKDLRLKPFSENDLYGISIRYPKDYQILMKAQKVVRETRNNNN